MIEPIEIITLVRQLNEDISMKVEPENGLELSNIFFMVYVCAGHNQCVEWNGITLWADDMEDFPVIETIEELETIIRHEYNKVMEMFRKVRI